MITTETGRNPARHRHARLGDIGALLLIAALLGFGAATLDDLSLGLIMLGAAVVSTLAVFQVTRRNPNSGVGPGILLSAAALASAFLLGLLGGDYRGLRHQDTLALLYGSGIVALLAGALLHQPFVRRPARAWLPSSAHPPFSSRGLVMVALAVIGAQVLNFLTGTIPALASDIDQVRFSGGTQGVLHSLGAFLVGGLEWIAVVGVITVAVRRRFDRTTLLLVLAALLVLALLASRSFLLIVALSLVIGVASLGRTSAVRLVVAAALGVALLAYTGEARLEKSDPTGERQAFLAANGYSGATGLIVQSASSGPWVFDVALTTVPDQVPFQHGAFFFRDFRAQLPGFLSGGVARSDVWVTDVLLRRDPAAIGGSPPTLVGGLFIDFGIVGIMVGCLILGFAYSVLHQWSIRAQTFGALALYSYASAWLVISAYSYISFKPIVLTVAALCLATHWVETRRKSRALTKQPRPVEADLGPAR